MMGEMVGDVLGEPSSRVTASGVASADEVRGLGGVLIAFSPEMTEDLARLRTFLHERMYRHWRVNRRRRQARRILPRVFTLFLADPDLPPAGLFGAPPCLGEAAPARRTSRCIAAPTAP